MNRRLFYVTASFLLTSLLALSGCDSSSPKPTEEVFGDVIIPATTKIFEERDLRRDLITVSDNLRTFIFDADSDIADDLRIGDVIVGGISDDTPFGFLRRVTEIQKNGGEIEVSTAQASLEEAVEQGEVALSRILSPSDVTQKRAVAPGVSLITPGKTAGEFFIDLKDVVVYDSDGNLSTKGDQITASGDITFEPSFDFDLRIRRFRIDEIRFVQDLKLRSDLTISSTIKLGGERKKRVAVYTFSPILIPIPPSPFPLVFVPQLAVDIGVDGSVSAGLETGIVYEADMEMGLEYDGQWEPVSALSQQVQFKTPTLNAAAEAEGFAKLPFSLLIYGVAGPFVAPRGYLEIKADLFDNPWWTLYWGVAADVGFTVDVLGRTIASQEIKDVIGFREQIADAGGPFTHSSPHPPVLSAPRDGTSNQPTSLTLDWESVNEADDYHVQVSRSTSFINTVVNQTDRSSSSYPISGLQNSATYYWRVRARNSAGFSGWSSTWSFTTVQQSSSDDRTGFESDLDGWTATTIRTATFERSTDLAHSGNYSFKAGPSSCVANCYNTNEQAISLTKDLDGRFVRAVEFWMLENSTRSSNFGQAGWIEIDGTRLDESVFDPHSTHNKQVWVRYEVNVSQNVNTLKFFFRDLTNSGALYLDDVRIVF